MKKTSFPAECFWKVDSCFKVLCLLLPVLLLGSGACTSGTRDDRIVITGSSTVAPLMADIAERFESLNPTLRIDVQSGGSSRGIADVRRGVADLGMVSRALRPGEEDLKGFPLARDGICMIVHSENPLKELSRQQILEVFRGRVRDWSELGGSPGRVTVVNKAEGRSTLEVFLRHFGLENSEIQAHVVIGDNEQGIKTVAGNPGAIGYVSIGAAEFSAAHGVPIRLLPLEGIFPDLKNVRSGAFPLVRTLILVASGEPSEKLCRFLEFAGSGKVEDLVRAHYFVPMH